MDNIIAIVFIKHVTGYKFSYMWDENIPGIKCTQNSNTIYANLYRQRVEYSIPKFVYFQLRIFMIVDIVI